MFYLFLAVSCCTWGWTRFPLLTSTFSYCGRYVQAVIVSQVIRASSWWTFSRRKSNPSSCWRFPLPQGCGRETSLLSSASHFDFNADKYWSLPVLVWCSPEIAAFFGISISSSLLSWSWTARSSPLTPTTSSWSTMTPFIAVSLW